MQVNILRMDGSIDYAEIPKGVSKVAIVHSQSKEHVLLPIVVSDCPLIPSIMPRAIPQCRSVYLLAYEEDIEPVFDYGAVHRWCGGREAIRRDFKILDKGNEMWYNRIFNNREKR